MHECEESVLPPSIYIGVGVYVCSVVLYVLVVLSVFVCFRR